MQKPSCDNCRHSKDDALDINNSNCADCLLRGNYLGFSPKIKILNKISKLIFNKRNHRFIISLLFCSFIFSSTWFISSKTVCFIVTAITLFVTLMVGFIFNDGGEH